MYGENLSWKPCHQILSFLVSQGLIREIDTRNMQKYDRRTNNIYEITQKGENVLKYFQLSRKLYGFSDVEINL